MTVLFDLDGTLTDPREGILGSLCHALTQLGITPPPFEDLRWVIGPPLQDSIAKILGESKTEHCAKCLDLYRERFGAVGLFENEVYDGIPAALQALVEHGHRLYVATSKPTVYSERIIEHFGLGQMFAKVYGSELDGRLIDKRDLIAHILATESLDPKKTVMIGDRRHDILGAKANNLQSIGVLYGYGSREELEEAGANALVNDPGDFSRHPMLQS